MNATLLITSGFAFLMLALVGGFALYMTKVANNKRKRQEPFEK